MSRPAFDPAEARKLTRELMRLAVEFKRHGAPAYRHCDRAAALLLAACDQVEAKDWLLGNMTMLIYRLIRRLNMPPGSDHAKTIAGVYDFLCRHGLQGSLLRDTEARRIDAGEGVGRDQ